MHLNRHQPHVCGNGKLILYHLMFKDNNKKESLASFHDRDNVLARKENWPVKDPDSSAAIAIPQSDSKAKFEAAKGSVEDVRTDSDEESSTEVTSVADTDEWIGEDERASNSIAPSVMSEPDLQRHHLMMQQPPRSILPFSMLLI